MKKPPNTPEKGDRFSLRGRTASGRLRDVNERLWAAVDWDAGVEAPKLCHLYELQKIGESA